jgi:hypothetical protein
VAYLTCEECVKLWVKYGIAARTDRDSISPDAPKTLEPILKEIEIHEAEAHAEVRAAASVFLPSGSIS